ERKKPTLRERTASETVLLCDVCFDRARSSPTQSVFAGPLSLSPAFQWDSSGGFRLPTPPPPHPPPHSTVDGVVKKSLSTLPLFTPGHVVQLLISARRCHRVARFTEH